MPDFLLQLRQILRSLRRAPGYAAAAVLTLAVGLAGALAALAPAWDLLGHPFDFRDPGRIVALSGEGRVGASFLRPLSAADFRDLERGVGGLQGVAACRDSVEDAETPEGIREIRTALVSPGFFQVLGMRLLLGRDFSREEGRQGGEPVVVLTHGFWMRAFGGDRGILGRSILLDGASSRVVGILGPQSHLPFFLEDAAVFHPLVFQGAETGRSMASCWVFGRLAEGASLGGLQAELDRLAPSLGPPRPAGDGSWGVKARGLLAYYRGLVAPQLAVTLLSGLLILLLACANAAHLMLARNLDRTREWGLRAALGARAAGLARPILLEVVLLCGLGTLLALPLLAGLQALGILPAPVLGGPILVPLALALALSVLGTSFLPMRWAGRLNLGEALREGGAASASRGSNALRGWLAVVQLALAFALLVGAGLSLRALERLQHIDPGYSLKDLHVAIVRVRNRGGSLDRALALQRHLLRSLGQVVQSAAIANTRPLVDQGHFGMVWAEGGVALEAGQHAISPGYFGTLGIPLLAGRNLGELERGACVVSREFARHSWGEASPLGRRVRLGSADSPGLEVVGVAGEARMSRLLREALPAVYTPLGLEDSGYLTVYLRSSAPPQALQDYVRRAVQDAGVEARLREFQSLEARAARELEDPARLRWQTLATGILAALLAGVGLAGTLAQAAARQRREWGIRMALGASPARLFGQVFLRVLALMAAGLGLGSGFAWGICRVLQHQFQGVDGADPLMVGLAMATLGLTCLLAGLGPALRAARTQPAEALRSE